MRRRTRADIPPDPAGVVRALRACRDSMLEVQSRVRPTGPVYHGAAMVISAIDGFATVLTGECHHFSIGGSVATDPRRDDQG